MAEQLTDRLDLSSLLDENVDKIYTYLFKRQELSEAEMEPKNSDFLDDSLSEGDTVDICGISEVSSVEMQDLDSAVSSPENGMWGREVLGEGVVAYSCDTSEVPSVVTIPLEQLVDLMNMASAVSSGLVQGSNKRPSSGDDTDGATPVKVSKMDLQREAEKRRKNNEASKRTREKRRNKEQELLKEKEIKEKENKALRTQVEDLEKQIKDRRSALKQRLTATS
ncbi:predicted protein [Nematostella vectensis]|uniref:BZIP domain-containing protein n=1 Tax=Nematostella vectensis TaxID=45351 RepID=A7S1X2_NEMVE|nr:thyrotroph embryonic factor [Nematostella vectensis]EDO42313.1 predicted protein [Nematostella vectensis]|eukprot:XP_001634376.1 predicted protein [Nematostella vectensis]